MINWPLAADYSMMLQNPQLAFKAAHLRQATIARDKHNLPLGLAGSFAVVYRATLPDGRDIAVRAFTSPNSERTQRYSAIYRYLQHHRLAQYIVDFEYMEKGIRSTDGKFYPLVTMEWVSGATLYEWVHAQCSKRNSTNLRSLAQKWIDLVQHLEDARIAHGDLQHGNVLVCNQLDLMLVDYDCMCVPDLIGRRNLEIGVEPYQHPDRNPDTKLSLQLDRFSAIFIFVALRALAAQPQLWQDFVLRDTYEKLLFRKSDFEAPENSLLCKALASSPDSEVPRLFESLTQLYHEDIGRIPSLREFLFSFNTVRSLISKKQYDEAVALISQHANRKAVPTDLQGPLSEARRRVECRKLIAQHVAAGDERAMARDYRPELLQDYPAAKSVADVAKRAEEVVRILNQMDTARRGADVYELVRLWDTHAALLRSRQCGVKLQTEIESWRKRNQLCRQIQSMLTADVGDIQLRPAWEKLRTLGGHPQLEKQTQQVDLLIQRSEAWHVFTLLSTDVSQDADLRRIKVWSESEQLFRDWTPAEGRRADVAAAQQRVTLVREIEKLTQQPLLVRREQQIVRLGATLPKGYRSRQAERIRTARLRLNAVRQLHDVLKASAGESAIAEAWQSLQQLHGDALVSPEARARFELARQRAPLLRRLKALPKRPPSATDDAILDIWNGRLLDGCREAAPWRQEYERALARRNCLRQLEAAVAAKNDEDICHWSSQPCLSGCTLPKATQDAVQESTNRLQNVNRLLQALVHDNRRDFCDLFDARLIRQFSKKFQPVRDQLVDWTRAEVLTASGVGLKEPVATSGVVQVNSSGRGYRLRWTWPGPRFVTQCVVGLAESDPGPGSDPRELSLPFRDVVSHAMYESAGGCRIIHPQETPPGCQVFIWAMVDLGFTQLASEPLLLGHLNRGRVIVTEITRCPNASIRYTLRTVLMALRPSSGEKASLPIVSLAIVPGPVPLCKPTCRSTTARSSVTCITTCRTTRRPRTVVNTPRQRLPSDWCSFPRYVCRRLVNSRSLLMSAIVRKTLPIASAPTLPTSCCGPSATKAPGGPPWTAPRLWNCPSWVETDDSSITHHLPPKSSLHDFAGGVTSCIDDDTVHRFFTRRSFFPEKLASDPRTRERWVAIGESKRQSLLANALHAFLEVAEQPNQSLVFVIEPEVAVLFFYTLARLVPARIARASHSFSTFESHVERLTTTLAATCFCDNERSDLAAEHYHRGHVLNSFKARPADWQPRQSGYAASAVRLLVEGNWKAVDRCLAEYDSAGATSVKHLHDLDRARELAEGMFDTTAPPGNVAGLPALARRFMAAHIRQAVNDDDGSRLAALHKSEPHAFALLRLIPDLLGHPGGEKARETLLGHVPEPMFPGLLNLDIPVADKVTALAMFGTAVADCPLTCPISGEMPSLAQCPGPRRDAMTWPLHCCRNCPLTL